MCRTKYGPAAPLLIFPVDGVHIRAVKMAPLQGPEAGGSGLAAVLHSRFMAVGLSAVDEHTVSGPKFMDDTSIDQPSRAGEDREKQAGMKPRAFALMWMQGLKGARLLQMKQTGTRKDRRGVDNPAGTDGICVVGAE